MIYIICTWHSGNENSIYDGNTAFNSIVWHINKEWLNVSIWRNSCYSRNVTLCLMKYWTPVKCSPLNLEIQLPFAWWAVLSDGTKSNWGSPYLTLIFLLTTYGFNSNAKNFLGILPQSAGPDSVPSYSSINSGCDLSSDPSDTSIHSLSSMTYNSSFFFSLQWNDRCSCHVFCVSFKILQLSVFSCWFYIVDIQFDWSEFGVFV